MARRDLDTYGGRVSIVTYEHGDGQLFDLEVHGDDGESFSSCSLTANNARTIAAILVETAAASDRRVADMNNRFQPGDRVISVADGSAWRGFHGVIDRCARDEYLGREVYKVMWVADAEGNPRKPFEGEGDHVVHYLEPDPYWLDSDEFEPEISMEDIKRRMTEGGS
jgi:hypothetical protein